MGRTQELVVTLRRASPTEPWGFSLVGGSDVNAPLIITRVSYGSPASVALERGDVITKIGNYDARDIRHQDAQNLFANTTNIRVVLHREGSSGRQNSAGSSLTSSKNYSPLSVSPHLSPKGASFSTPSMASPAGSALTPYYSSQFTPLDNYHYTMTEFLPGRRRRDDGNTDIPLVQQPYRTTPLVLPGAKVKREPGPTECYLRHHPNPAVRAPPHHLDTDFLIRQKITDNVLSRIGVNDPKIVNKQFNSPIGMYSDANVADSLYRTTGQSPGRKTVKFNPAESETYKALQEEHNMGGYVHEVNVPPQARVYAPQKHIPHPKPQQHPVNQHQYNTMGDPNETIHQSNSFKRLMYSVLAESNY